jgi:hypothetical protein
MNILNLMPKKRKDFVRVILNNFRVSGTLMPVEKLVRVTKKYFHVLFIEQTRRGRKRESSHLSSAQTALSRIKTAFAELGVDEAYLRQIRLCPEDTKNLLNTKSRKVHEAGIHLPQAPADSIVMDCRDIITKSDSPKHLKVIALAALTGRRLVEILHTIRVNPPRAKHNTHLKYWCCMQGMAKQRGQDVCIEVPLLATRTAIQKCLREVRASFEPPPTHLSDSEKKSWVNERYGKPISRCMQKYCPVVAKLHNFRKFYALTSHHYHNGSGSSLSRFASDVLGHRQTSASVLTYMNFRITDIGKLDFTV